MRSIGVRELKNKLSQYLRLVQAGEELLVTDRGRVIAQISQPTRSAFEALAPGLGDLARRGLVRIGADNSPAAYRRLKAAGKPGAAKRLLDAVRSER